MIFNSLVEADSEDLHQSTMYMLTKEQSSSLVENKDDGKK